MPFGLISFMEVKRKDRKAFLMEKMKIFST